MSTWGWKTDPPISVFVASTANLSKPLMVGQTGNTLTCVVSGADSLDPVITYRWTRNDGTTHIPVRTKSISETISISPLRLSYAGVYICSVNISSTLLRNNISLSAGNDTESVIIQSVSESEPVCTVSDATLLSVANYTLNDEAGRVERLDGIETKFYSLQKYDVIASAFVFATEVIRGKTEVFAFILVLPYSMMADYLARHSLCETRVQKMLQNYFIIPLQNLSQYHRPLREKIEKVIEGFNDPLFNFTQTMRKLSQYALPEKISVTDTFLGKELPVKSFLQHAITCHLQTSGYTVVLGSDKDAVNKMILTLALFLSSKERKMSRLVCSDLGELDTYEPDIFLQGFVVQLDPTASLPFTKREFYSNKLPPIILNCDTGEIRLVEPKIPLFIRQREDMENDTKQNLKSAERETTLVTTELSSFKSVEKDWQSQLVSNFIEQMKLLPLHPGVRESFVYQYLRLLKLKSLAMSKYIDAEPKISLPEMAMEVLALGRGPSSETRPKVNKLALMQNLSIDSYGDLLVVLAFAEKIRPRTYMDVLGDPHLNDLAMIKEFETF